MNDKRGQSGRRTPGEDFPEFGEIRVVSKPAPDAEDRLRRLFVLLLRHAAGERGDASGKATPETPRPDDDIESEA